MGCVHTQSQNQRSSFLPTVHCSCWLKSNFKAYASKLCQSMLNYAQPKTVPGLYKEGKTPGYYSNEIFKHFLQSCGSIVQRNKFIRNWFQYNKLPSFLPSLGIVALSFRAISKFPHVWNHLFACKVWTFYFDLSTVAPATMPSSITLTEQKSGENTFVALLSIMIPSPLSLLASVPYC